MIPSATSSTVSIDINDPRLTTTIDYSAVLDTDHGLEIAPRYQTMSMVQQRYVLALWRAGERILAQRAANCYRAGTLYMVCPMRKYARGYKHRCGDPLCVTCSRPKIRFQAWGATRDHSIFRQPCTGIEFFGGDAWDRETLNKAVGNTLRLHVGPDALMVDAFDCHGKPSVRCIVPTEDVYRKDIQHKWVCKVSVRHDDPASLYIWAFSGMLAPACMSPDDKASLRIAIKGAHLTRTIGTYYSPLSKAELLELRASEAHERHTCPACKDHELEILALEQRHAEEVTEAESRYDQVEWGAEHETLLLVRRSNPTEKSVAVYNESPFSSPEVAAPPPW